MSNFDWRELLRRWNEAMLASPLATSLPVEARESGWLGFPQATESQIARAEERLKIALPPSYKAFLRVSNGWLRTSHAIERVWGTDQINWFRKTHREWVSVYA